LTGNQGGRKHMRKQILIGLAIAVALLGLVGVTAAAAGGPPRGDAGNARQAQPRMDCIGPNACG
jgi:hypothetical protein